MSKSAWLKLGVIASVVAAIATIIAIFVVSDDGSDETTSQSRNVRRAEGSGNTVACDYTEPPQIPLYPAIRAVSKSATARHRSRSS